MPTTKTDVTPSDGWIRVAQQNDSNMLLENAAMIPFYMTLVNPDNGAPAADEEAFHRIYGRERIYREDLQSDIYIRVPDEFSGEDITQVSVVVSKD